MFNLPRVVREADLAAIQKRSVRNCHAENVDSIVFDATPGAVIRMFIAGPAHTLWRNTVPHRFSVGFHGHHCAVTLVARTGRAWNVTLLDEPKTWIGHAYRWASPLRGQAGHFRRVEGQGSVINGTPAFTRITWLPQAAHVLHTVFLHQHETAAWWVLEGMEDYGYEPICYSNDDLTTFDATKHYTPMPFEILRAHLDDVGIAVRP